MSSSPRTWTELHGNNNLTKQTSLTEKGTMVSGAADTPNQHDILTGTQPDGTAFAGADDKTCGNWTKSGEGSAIVGHIDRDGLPQDPVPVRTSWNSSHPTKGCSDPALVSTGGAGLSILFRDELTSLRQTNAPACPGRLRFCAPCCASCDEHATIGRPCHYMESPLPESNDAEQQPRLPAPMHGGPSRREFLRATAAIAGTTLLGSCLSGGSDDGDAPEVGGAEKFLANINQLVVVMFENRSFDNLMGYLYSDPSFPTPANWPSGWSVPQKIPQLTGKPTQTFNGLWQFPGAAPLSPTACTGVAGCNTLAASYQPVVAYPHNFPACPGGTGPVPPTFAWNFPNPNAEEGFKATAEQLGKLTAQAGSTSSRYEMTGFLQGYSASTGTPAPIMGSYTPDQLPVLSTLARSFAVFDRWHCAVPSETYCNRAFFHASTSWGFVENGSSQNDAPPASSWTKWQAPPGFVSQNSIFDLLEAAKVGWGVYFSVPGKPAADETQIAEVFSQVGLTGLVHYEVGKNYGPPAYQATQPGVPGKQRFWPLENFFTDVSTGKLPAYTFIEPIYGAFPGNPTLPGGHDFHPNEDVRQGEEVIRQIYEAIRTSGSGAKDYTKDTMLLIVFDEHGGNLRSRFAADRRASAGDRESASRGQLRLHRPGPARAGDRDLVIHTGKHDREPAIASRGSHQYADAEVRLHGDVQAVPDRA